MAHDFVLFGNCAINPALVTHAEWNEEAGTLDVYTVNCHKALPLTHADVDKAARAVGLGHCCDEHHAKVKAAEKAAAAVEKAEARADAAAEKASHAHK